MSQTLVIHKKFFTSLYFPERTAIMKSHGYETPEIMMKSIIAKLNYEYSGYLNIESYRFFTELEKMSNSMYSSFVEGLPESYPKITIFFTQLDSKLGNTIISQQIMPVLSSRYKQLFDQSEKFIVVLTSQINQENKITNYRYNTLQLNVNILNSIGIDVLQFIQIKGLSTDSRFTNLNEYLSFVTKLQDGKSNNSQVDYITLENDTVYGNADPSDLQGQFFKHFVFRFIGAVGVGRKKYKYNLDRIMALKDADSQIKSLNKFIEYYNSSLDELKPLNIEDENIQEEDVELPDERLNDKNTEPEKATIVGGKKRYKTRKSVREKAILKNNYLCDCHDQKHFYFEAMDTLQNYVEGHHVIPMSMQESYWNDHRTNLDIVDNIIPLCPTCHKQVHLGSRMSRLLVLGEIYTRHERTLLSIDRELSFSKFSSFYNIIVTVPEEKELLIRSRRLVNKKNAENI